MPAFSALHMPTALVNVELLEENGGNSHSPRALTDGIVQRWARLRWCAAAAPHTSRPHTRAQIQFEKSNATEPNDGILLRTYTNCVRGLTGVSIIFKI